MNVEDVVRMLCFGRDMCDFFLLAEMEGWEKSLYCWCSVAGVETERSGVASTSGDGKLSSGVSLDDMLRSSSNGRSFTTSFSRSFSLSFLRSFVRFAPRN